MKKISKRIVKLVSLRVRTGLLFERINVVIVFF